jgi:hypothetical protein
MTQTMLLKIVISILVFILCAFGREVILFILHERKPSTRIFFGKEITFAHSLAHLPLLTYDLHYRYAFVPFEENLDNWCFELLSEVLAVCKKKYPVVTSIYYFKRHEHIPDLPMIWESRLDCDTLVIIPLTRAKAIVENKSFLCSSFIFANPPSSIKITCEEFLLVNTRQCLAWNV